MANRKVLIGAGVVAGLAATVAAVPYFIDWSFFEPQMIAAVENATGYDVEVGGELRFTLLPRPALVVDQVSITGFGAERQPLIRAEQLSAAVAFWPLFGKRVEVDHIALKTPVVRIVSYADGSNNWSRPEEASAKSSTTIRIADFRIENGTLIKRAATGSELRFDDIDATLSVPSLDGPYGIDGRLVWNKLPILLKANYAMGGGLKVDADIEDAGRIVFAGRLPEVAADAPQAIAGTLTVTAPTLDGFLDKFSDDPGNAEPSPAMAAPLRIAGRLSGTTEAMRLAALSGSVGGSRIGGDVLLRFAEATGISGRLALDALDAAAWSSPDGGEDSEPFTIPEGYAADLLLSIGKLSYGRAPLGSVVAPLKLADQLLTVGRTAVALPAGGRAFFAGTIDTPEKLGLRVRGTISAEMPRPSATLAAFDIGSPAGLPSLTLAGPMTIAREVVTLTNARGRFDGSAYVASARYPLAEGQPSEVSVVADRINFDRLRGDNTRPAKAGEAGKTVRFTVATQQLLNEGRAFAGVRGQGVYEGDKVTLTRASARDAFGFAVQGKGSIADLSGDMNTDLAVSLSGADTRGSVAIRGPLRQMTVNGTVDYAGAAVGIDGWIKTEPQLTYQIDVDARAAEAARVLGQPQSIGPLAMTLRASGSGDRATLSNIAGTVGPMKLAGSAVVNTAGARPVVTAVLRAGEVSLDKLWGRSATGAAAAARDPGARWSKEA
ncbi:MAG: AsmA family protein, partial [Sphingomonadaceae bacterium]|nr:AsmA family protein [Sphingomonadaceae bacterium]